MEIPIVKPGRVLVWAWQEILGCVWGTYMTQSWGLVDLATAKIRRELISVPPQVPITLGCCRGGDEITYADNPRTKPVPVSPPDTV
jgi:hypothetical protein